MLKKYILYKVQLLETQLDYRRVNVMFYKNIKIKQRELKGQSINQKKKQRVCREIILTRRDRCLDFPPAVASSVRLHLGRS